MSEPKKENTILERMLTNPPVKHRARTPIAIFPAIDIKTHSVSIDNKGNYIQVYTK